MNKQIREIKELLNSICQLCGRKVDRLVCDHDHVIEMVRGLVCDICNIHVIGAGERRPELVSQRVLNYLASPPLGHLKIRYKNPPPGGRRHFFLGNREGGLGTAYRELFYGKGKGDDRLVAEIRMREQSDRSWVSQVLFMKSRKNAVVHQDSWDEEDLLERAVSMLRKRQNL